MTPDELQAAIDRAEIKRRQLVSGYQEGAEVARILPTVPRAAELCEKRIALGLLGDKEACEEARIILRSLIPDRVRLSKKADGSLWAHCAIQPAALLEATGNTWSG
jgi:site-specific DNA recombinase